MIRHVPTGKLHKFVILGTATLIGAALAGSAFVTSPAFAQDPTPTADRPGMLRRSPSTAASGRRMELGKVGRSAAEMMKSARERVMKMPPAERAALRERHKQARAQRRDAMVARARSRWGASLKSPEVQAELRQHAERMARLHRMQVLAEDNGKDALLDRVFALMKREQQRHMRTMTQLHGSSGGPGGGFSGGAAGGSTP